MCNFVKQLSSTDGTRLLVHQQQAAALPLQLATQARAHAQACFEPLAQKMHATCARVACYGFAEAARRPWHSGKVCKTASTLPQSQ